MRTVNGQTIGDIFEFEEDQYRVTRFITDKTVVGECIKSNKVAPPDGCKVAISKVTWITKMRASTGKQAFSVPNNVEGRMFIDLAKMFKRKGVRVHDKARSKDRDTNKANADWFSVYISNPNDNIVKENKELKENLIIEGEIIDKYKGLEKTLNAEIEDQKKKVELVLNSKIQLEAEKDNAVHDANKISEEVSRIVRLVTEHNAKSWWKRHKQLNIEVK